MMQIMMKDPVARNFPPRGDNAPLGLTPRMRQHLDAMRRLDPERPIGPKAKP
jgi:hypothetical protein